MYACLRKCYILKDVRSGKFDAKSEGEVHEAEPTKEPEQYKSFIYFYEGMPTKEDVIDQVVNQQQVSITAES